MGLGMMRPTVPANVTEYIAGFPPKVRAPLRKVRATARRAAPDAEETISYRMPTMKQNGVVLYYAAFKDHLSLFPPVRGDARLVQDCAPYANAKGNLLFPYEGPLPLRLIERIVRHRVKQNAAKAGAKRKRNRS